MEIKFVILLPKHKFLTKVVLTKVVEKVPASLSFKNYRIKCSALYNTIPSLLDIWNIGGTELRHMQVSQSSISTTTVMTRRSLD